MATANQTFIFFVFFTITSSLCLAIDPSPLQDFCVADLTSQVLVNGFTCKNPKTVKAKDFFLSGFNKPGNTMNPLGINLTPATVAQLPGLNTLGLSLVRIDYAPGGVNPPHTHPRASEIIVVLEGTLYAGFVTSSPNDILYSKVLSAGDVFVFPQGLTHFSMNYGYSNAVALVALNSQKPGRIIAANNVFGSKPLISDDLLAKAFQLSKETVDKLQGKHWPANNVLFGSKPLISDVLLTKAYIPGEHEHC
ncbi:putative germin-like protein 2-1 [Dioscorea cayenensis subsp. rotundata]|uniref:Germin-like protein n=1 Tax=Dioscorea cayennensis subsp. rotundata TaxID=55577 RepID=A0AB40BJQ0_DIOCR|nr:putative germin-like protein 2-1 [Dioscorea cayenensis subsp. rotundata]